MSELKIEKNVPIPKVTRRYPFSLMEVGDSVYIPCEANEAAKQVSQRITGSMSMLRPRKFTRRSDVGGVRVWRVS